MACHDDSARLPTFTAPFRSLPLQAAPFHGVLLQAAPFHGAPLEAAPFGDVPLQAAQLVRALLQRITPAHTDSFQEKLSVALFL
eukprot:1156257-Pelagomonas_calceolata.AAC.15